MHMPWQRFRGCTLQNLCTYLHYKDPLCLIEDIIRKPRIEVVDRIPLRKFCDRLALP